MEKRICQLPGWLWPTSNALPPLYRRVWEAVKEGRLNLGVMQGELLVNTNKVFPLLLTSQLPTEVLGYIWSLANQKYAGQLTEQELYVVLALVAIAQTSHAFTNVDILHMLPGPPIPQLNLTSLYSNTSIPQLSTLESSVFCEFDKQLDQRSNRFPTSNVYSSTTIVPSSIINSSYPGAIKMNSEPLVRSTNKDIVAERPSSLSQEIKVELGNCSLDFSDDFSDFQSAPIQSLLNIPMWDSKQGSAIGNRLANHNLSGGKKLTEKKKLSAYKRYHGNNTIPSSSELTSPIISKDRSPETSGNLFSKCNVKNQPKTTVILRDTAIRSEPLPQTSINSREIDVEKYTDIASIPKQLNPLFAKVPEGSIQNLMSLQPVEDKYSALRILVEKPTPCSVISPTLSTSVEPLDDFGEFVSAEKMERITVDSIQSTADTSLELFPNFEQFLPNSNNGKSEVSFSQETIQALAQLEITVSPGKTINFLEEKYDATIDPEKVIQKEDTISINSIDLGNGVAGVLTRSNSVPSLDLKLFFPSNIEDEKEIETMNQLIYCQWKHYMENCVLLLQVAANIFMNITSDVIMQEILNSAQGYNFLCNLAEVAAVCRRVNFSHKEMDINIMGFDDLLMDIDRIWVEMEPFYANITIVTELPAWPTTPGEDTTCALCLTMILREKIIHNDNAYHPTCANLWLNCVNSNLPALRYVSGYSHSIVADVSSNSS